MADRMSPADVPDDLVQAAARGMSNRKSPEGINYAPDGWWEDDARAALAAVLPIHEQQVRERIARGLELKSDQCDQDAEAYADERSPLLSAQGEALWDAARQIRDGGG